MSNQFNGGQFPNGNYYGQQQQYPNGVAGVTQQFQNMGMNGAAAKQPDQFAAAQQQQYGYTGYENQQQPQADPNQYYYDQQQQQQWQQQNQYADPNAAYNQAPPAAAAAGNQQQYYDQQGQQYDQYGQPVQQNDQQYYQGAGGISQSPSADSLYQTPNMRAGQFQQDGLDAPQPGTLSASSSQQKLPQQSPKPAQRIDPKQIPRTETERPSEQITRYMTCSGLVPPPSTSNFVVVDEGNCSPRFVRMTTYQVASDEDLVDQTKLVIGALIQPLADLGNDEEEIHVVDCGPSGPVRCTRCRAYINPFFKFIAEGSKFICSLCGHENAVPEHYRCNLDPNGFRRDRFSRPELCRGTVEFVAPPEFIVRPIQDPCYLFVLDVSYSAVVSGFLRSAIDAIRVSLDGLANNPRARVGFITYNSSVQFYAIKPPRKAPQMYVVADVDEVFAPVPPDDLLVRPSDPAARALIDALLAMIPDMYESSRIQGCALGASVQGALETLRTLGGKVILTQSNLPQVGAGSLENRDDVKLYYTEQEKNLFVPQTSFYERIATECAEQAITVDLYVAANSYVDVATVGALSAFTGGQVYFYEGFNQNKDGQALVADIWHDLTRRTGFDAVMVVRSSDNLKVHETYGNFFRRRPHELELPSIDSDKTFGITLKHDGKLSDKTPACIQTALAYTTAEGQRRIRIHTISLPVTTTMANIFRYADLDAVLALSLKQACKQILHTTTPAKVRQALVTACIDSLFTYRKFCAQSTSPGQLILPESLKLLPLSTLGMIKHPLFHNGQRSDERAFLFSFVASMPTYVAVPFICPRLFSLADIPPESCIPDSTGRVFLPPCQSLSSDSIKPEGLYLLDDGRYLTVWIGDQLHPDIFREVFDIDPAVSGFHPSQLAFTEKHSENPGHLATRILMLLYQLRKRKPNFPNLSFIARKQPAHHQDPMMAKALTAETLDESQFFKHLLEDAGGLQSYNVMTEDGDVKKGKDGAKDPSMMSYIDFLCHIHKRIQDKFY